MSDDPSVWSDITPRSAVEWAMALALIVGFVVLALFGGTCSISIRTTDAPTTTTIERPA